MDILKKLRTALSKAKITEDEIAFYEAVLKKPGSTAFEISKRAGFSKDRGYAIFESLQNKGLVTTKEVAHRRGVYALSLKAFSEKLFSKSREFWRTGETLESLNSALPFLHEKGEPTQIEAHTVDEFPESWLDLSYMPFDYVFGYGNFDMILEHTGIDCDRQFIDRRIKRGKKAEVALYPGMYTEQLVKSDKNELRRTKILEIPELQNKLAVVFPTLHTVSLWQKDEKGIVSGLNIKNANITRFHEDLYHYFKKQATNMLTSSK
jgi:hypothetical protein